MKVLLIEDVQGLGKIGDIVQVKPGYGRNYLIPRNMAVKPSEGAIKDLKQRQKKLGKIHKKFVDDASKVREAIQTIPFVTIEHRTNEEGVLYGSISPSMIAESLRDYGIKIEPKSVELGEHIKKTGDYEVQINLYKDVLANLKVKVIPTLEVKTKQEENATPPTTSQNE